MTATEIRARMRKRLAAVAMKLAMIKADEDEKYPEEHRRTREKQRSELFREWNTIESQGIAELREWQKQANEEAQRIYHSDPIGDAASESRRVSENLEIARLAEPLIGSGRTMIDNHLLTEARRFLALDLPDKARLYVEAARRAGHDDSTIRNAVEAAYDRSIPHRKRARDLMNEAEVQSDLIENDRFSLRLVHGVGDQVQASTAAKLLAARRGESTPAGLLGSSHGEAQVHKAAAAAGTTE